MTSKRRNLWQWLRESNDGQVQEVMERFDLYNQSLGNALSVLSEQPHDIQGREKEMQRLVHVLERPLSPVALLLGEAGVGKSALCEAFQKAINNDALAIGIERRYLMLSLDLGMFSALENHHKQAALANLLPSLHAYERAFRVVSGIDELRLVLFIDEIHMLVTIFGEGTKVGGDVMKRVLARPPIRVVGATTRREYDSTIAVDKPLAQRFKQIEMSPVGDTVVLSILKNWWDKTCGQLPAPADDDLMFMIEANKNYRSDSAEPRRSMDLLEDLASVAALDGHRPNREDIARAFSERYSVATSLGIDPISAYDHISSKVFGQRHAMATIRKALRSLAFQLDDTSNRPRMCTLMLGSTGTGKTATVKAFAEAIYPDKGQDSIVFLNMPDYNGEDSEPKMRKDIGEALAHNPSAVILLDEVEKAHVRCLDSLLYILQEGMVKYNVVTREGRVETDHSSLRNSFIFATTNAGDKVFQVDGKYNQSSVVSDSKQDILDAELESLEKAAMEDLKQRGLFKPELLGRFNRILLYRALDEQALIRITQRELDSLAARFETRGIQVCFEQPRIYPTVSQTVPVTDVAGFVMLAKAAPSDASAGGARSIEKAVDVYVKDTIIDSVIDNPQAKEFLVKVSPDSFIHKAGALYSEGGVIVEPLA